MATLETSLEANYDGHRTDRRTKRLIGTQATALPQKANASSQVQKPSQSELTLKLFLRGLAGGAWLRIENKINAN